MTKIRLNNSLCGKKEGQFVLFRNYSNNITPRLIVEITDTDFKIINEYHYNEFLNNPQTGISGRCLNVRKFKINCIFETYESYINTIYSIFKYYGIELDGFKLCELDAQYIGDMIACHRDTISNSHIDCILAYFNKSVEIKNRPETIPF